MESIEKRRAAIDEVEVETEADLGWRLGWFERGMAGLEVARTAGSKQALARRANDAPLPPAWLGS
jgi:hypothetical protein